MSRIPEGTRATVLLRSGGDCERCGRSVANTPADLHHRRPRGMGGTKAPDIHAAANLVLLCRDCHTWVETHRTEASEHGWLVLRRDPREPIDVPVWCAGEWWWVTDAMFTPADLDPPF